VTGDEKMKRPDPRVPSVLVREIRG